MDVGSQIVKHPDWIRTPGRSEVQDIGGFGGEVSHPRRDGSGLTNA